MKENTTKSIMACQKAAHGGLSLSNNPFGEVWGTRRSSKVNSYRPAFPGRSIFAEGATRTLCSFRSPPPGRFGPSAQVPTGHTLPSGAGRAGSLRPWAQTFLKLLAEKAAAGGLFRQAARPAPFARGAFSGCKPRPSVVKYPRSRLRAGNARETARPITVAREPPLRLRGRSRPRRAPRLCAPSANPRRPAPDIRRKQR